MHGKSIAMFAAIISVAVNAHAGWFGESFSADALQIAPGRPNISGRMFVDHGRVRTEVNEPGRMRVQILDPEHGKAWLLIPAQKAYVESPLSPSTTMFQARNDEPIACLQKSLQCKKEGTVSLNGRDAVRWHMQGQDGEKPLDATVWLDAAHGFPVREQVNGRPVKEMRYLGQDNVAGRTTEKWQTTHWTSNGERVQTTDWYDTKLNIAIRQELPNGAVRELSHIVTGPQLDSLFEVPIGFHRVQAPPATKAQPGMTQ